MPLQKYTFTATLTIRENLDNREGKQILHLETNDILLGLKKAFDVTLNFNYRGPECLQGDYFKCLLLISSI